MSSRRRSLFAMGLLAGALTLLRPAVGLAQQQPSKRPQPGTKWTVDQLRQAAAPVRAGRKLTPKSWPNGTRVAVCLSFDVDTESFTLADGNTAPVTLSQGDFGAEEGLPRVLELLDRHNIPASFFIPAVSAVLHPQIVQEITKRNRHEIGIHGWIHENLPDLDNAAEEERLLNQAIDFWTKAVGKRPVGYRAPYWAFSKYTMDLIRKAGFEYDSSAMAMDEPYELVSNGQPTGMVELPVDWVLDDYPYFNSAGTLPSPELILQVYKDEFDWAYQTGTMFMLTMHPQIVGHRSRMVDLEKLVSYMQSKPGVWFATAGQIVEYVKQSAKTN